MTLTAAQRDALTAMGCTYGQGYLSARPLPVEDVDVLLAEQATRTGVGAAAPTTA